MISNDDEMEATGAELDGDFTRLKRTVVEGHRARNFFLKEQDECYKFVANNQWSDDDRALLASQSRPVVSFNRIGAIIKAICGLEVNNRQKVAYLPRTQGNVGVDEARTSISDWVRGKCKAEYVESQAFRDLAICGEGWTETYMCYDNKPEGEIIEKRIHPREMGTNASAEEQNYQDAHLIYHARMMDNADAQALVGTEYLPEAIHAGWFENSQMPEDGGEGNKRDYPAETRSGLERTSTRKQVRVVKVQWWDREPHHLVSIDGDEELHVMPKKDFSKFQDRVNMLRQQDDAAMQAHTANLNAYSAQAEADPTYAALNPPPTPPQPTAPTYDHTPIRKKVYYEAFLGANDVLGRTQLQMGEFQYKAMTGDRDDEHKCFYGVVRDMLDPQRWANKWLAQTMHILNTNAKGGIMAETDAFLNSRRAERDWADNTKIIWVKSGALSKGKVKERTPPPLPQGLSELMQFALSSLRDVTGVNLELLGQADREQAASLEAQRRQAAMTILATLFDSLRSFRIDQGGLMLKFIDLLPDNMLYPVLDQGQWKYMRMVKDRKAQDYDVIIDQAPSSPDQKQATWALTLELIRSGIPLPPPVIIKLLKYSPYPETVVQEISAAMGLNGQDPPEVLQQKLQQAEQALQALHAQLQQAQAAAEHAENDQEVAQLKALVDVYKAETDRLQVEVSTKNRPNDGTGAPPVRSVAGEIQPA